MNEGHQPLDVPHDVAVILGVLATIDWWTYEENYIARAALANY